MKNEKGQNIQEENTMAESILRKKKESSVSNGLSMLRKKIEDGIQEIDNTYELSVEALNKWNTEETRKIDDELTRIKEKYSPDVIDTSWEGKKSEILKSLEEKHKSNLLEEQKLQDEINKLQQKAESLLKGNKR